MRIRLPEARHFSAPHIVARAAAILSLGPERPILVVTPDTIEAEELFDLLSALAPDRARHLDPWDVLPFEPASLDPSAAGRRVETLSALAAESPIVVASARAVARLTLPAARWATLFRRIAFSDELPPRRLRELLVAYGYSAVAEVSAPGEFAARGGLLDLHSPGLSHPARIEWDGDLIESIRLFDPQSQRTINAVDSICIYPPREAILPEGDRESAIAEIESAVKPSIRRDRFIEAIREGAFVEGLEVLQPFYGEVASIFDFKDIEVVIIDEEFARERIQEIFEEAVRESEDSDIGYDAKRSWLEVLPLLPDAFRIETLPSGDIPTIDTEPLPPAAVDAQVLRTDIARVAETHETFIITSLPKRVRELLPDETAMIIDGNLMYGAILPESKIAIVGDADLFGRRRKKTARGKKAKAAADWGALRPGDYVVHLHHGVGIFRGIERITSLGETRDAVLIEYAGGDKLYLAPHETGFVERYTVLEGQTPRLDKLGAAGWAKIRERAERETVEIARELLDLYALRSMTDGVKFGSLEEEESFARGFGYEETPDQARSIDEILSDLTKTENRLPMDRLLCGDVGFGKTEVALRAVFRVVRHGKQVAVLCPTTILALQHTETFRDRLEPFGVTVGTLSRFQTSDQIKKTLAGLADGRVNVVIGTHKLLGKQVAFRDLGLVVVDEEQRFGVRHKENLKNLRRQTDILTMTATPIPRTLHLALSGARSISLIETPPPGRAPVQTIVEPFNENHVRSAIRRELDRDGQIFYVHNRIETLDRVFDFLHRLFPKVAMEMAHGRMKEDELSETMKRFLDGRTTILVSTSIVENGLDIPRANTMIVDSAENFGLSQLYQLRGRVGRSRIKAYAYFFHGPVSSITQNARARLAAIAEHTALGAGYSIAHRDMEIRGAGEILGSSQSGEMEAIGYDMYCRLLREAIDELRGGKKREERPRPIVDLLLSAYLPADWLGGDELVGAVHREIAGADSVAKVDAVRETLIDRFGHPPEPVENLLEIAKLRAYAELDGAEAIIETEYDLTIRWKGGVGEREKHLMTLVPPLYVKILDGVAVIENLPKDRSRLAWIRRILRR